MKLKKVTSQYKNPDKYIETLKKQTQKWIQANLRTLEKSAEFREMMERRAGTPVIRWKEGTLNEQSLLATVPNEIHVGTNIATSGRVVEITERLNKKGQPTSIIKYELKETRAIPNIVVLPESVE